MYPGLLRPPWLRRYQRQVLLSACSRAVSNSARRTAVRLWYPPVQEIVPGVSGCDGSVDREQVVVRGLDGYLVEANSWRPWKGAARGVLSHVSPSFLVTSHPPCIALEPSLEE